jgi:hypothetical protein
VLVFSHKLAMIDLSTYSYKVTYISRTDWPTEVTYLGLYEDQLHAKQQFQYPSTLELELDPEKCPRKYKFWFSYKNGSE